MIKKHYIWSMKLHNDSSWTLRKIFALRCEGQKFILFRIGNGSNKFFWLDNWHTLALYFRDMGTKWLLTLEGLFMQQLIQ